MSIADLAEPPVPAAPRPSQGPAEAPAEAPAGTPGPVSVAEQGGPGAPDVDVVVPVHDEEADLGPSVRRLHAYLSRSFPFTWRITIAAEFRRPPAGNTFVGQALRFAAVGVVSTLAYLAFFVLLRTAMPAVPANALALLVTALANTAANRRFTFEVAGRHGAVRHHLHGLALFAAGLALSSGALTGLHLADPTPARALEIGVLVVANAVTTALRFVAMRWWVFAPADRPAPLEDPR